MFEVGFWELALIFVLLLVVVGPERLPKMARTAGFWVGKARRMVAAMRSEVEQELHLDEVRRSLAQQAHTEEFQRLADQVRSINSDIRAIGSDVRTSIEKTPSLAKSADADHQPSEPAATASNPPSVK